MHEPVSIAAFIGIDWADRKHDVCLSVRDSDSPEFSVLDHRPIAIQKWAQGLRERFCGGPIAVCIELSPIVSALLEHDFFVIFPVNPSTLAEYRRAVMPSGAKDDPTDAQVALDLLLRHRDKLKPLQRERPDMRALRQLVEARRDLVQDRVRITNRLTYALKAHFPQVLQWFRDKETDVFIDFSAKWPSLQAAKRARPDTVVRFFHSHNVRYPSVVKRRLDAIKAETALTSDAAVIEPTQLVVQALLPQLRALNEAIPALDAAIARCDHLPDFRLFAELPGAGPVFAARLLAAFGEQRDRFDSAAAIQKYVGVAPITERSGNKHWVHWRWACPTFLRQTFVEWAGETIPRSFWARAFYESHKAKGATHNAAISGPGIQVDPHPLPLLDRQDPVRRISLLDRPPETPRSTAQVRRFRTFIIRLRSASGRGLGSGKRVFPPSTAIFPAASLWPAQRRHDSIDCISKRD
jgi:transposase